MIRRHRLGSNATRLLSLLLACLTSLAQPAVLTADENQFLTGQFLVATPEMSDPRFAETIIYMVKHDVTGAMGLIINRPLAKVSMRDLLKGFNIEAKRARGEIVVHFGGPVEPRVGFVLHSDDHLIKTSNLVKDGIAMTADAQMLQAMALGKGPRQALFMMGYAGWAPGQLEAEIKANSWFTTPADKDLIFGGDTENKWRRALDKRKVRA